MVQGRDNSFQIRLRTTTHWGTLGARPLYSLSIRSKSVSRSLPARARHWSFHSKRLGITTHGVRKQYRDDTLAEGIDIGHDQLFEYRFYKKQNPIRAPLRSGRYTSESVTGCVGRLTRAAGSDGGSSRFCGLARGRCIARFR